MKTRTILYRFPLSNPRPRDVCGVAYLHQSRNWCYLVEERYGIFRRASENERAEIQRGLKKLQLEEAA